MRCPLDLQVHIVETGELLAPHIARKEPLPLLPVWDRREVQQSAANMLDARDVWDATHDGYVNIDVDETLSLSDRKCRLIDDTCRLIDETCYTWIASRFAGGSSHSRPSKGLSFTSIASSGARRAC